MQLKYYGYEDAIGEDATYFGNILKTSSVYIIPFINLYITEEHPLNSSKTYSEKIDKAYLVFQNYKSIKMTVYHSRNDIGTSYKESVNIPFNNLKTIYIGGNSLQNRFNNNYELFENVNWKVECETFYIQLLENSRIARELFLPFDTPTRKSNMDMNEVRNFIENKYLPNELDDLIKHPTNTYYSIGEFEPCMVA